MNLHDKLTELSNAGSKVLFLGETSTGNLGAKTAVVTRSDMPGHVLDIYYQTSNGGISMRRWSGSEAGFEMLIDRLRFIIRENLDR